MYLWTFYLIFKNI